MDDVLRQQYERRVGLLQSLEAALTAELTQCLAGLPHIDRLSFRVKSVGSFLRKVRDHGADAPYAAPLIEVEDQVAGRVIVFFLSDIRAVLDRLEGTFTSVEEQHRRPAPDAEFGYESEHLVCVIPPHVKPVGWDDRDDLPTTFELQVRTIFMHAWAEPQHDISYKSASDLPHDVRRELAWIAASAWGADQAYERVRQRLAPATLDEGS
jgi:putative GTP pyrophosphokinase